MPQSIKCAKKQSKKGGNALKPENRKELINQYKERKLIGGICAIHNNSNGKRLISAETDIEAFKNRFQFSLQSNTCMSFKYQRDWLKNGAQSFELEILEVLEKKEEQAMDDYVEELKLLEDMILEKFEKESLY
jgi:hypothetical protein